MAQTKAKFAQFKQAVCHDIGTDKMNELRYWFTGFKRGLIDVHAALTTTLSGQQLERYQLILNIIKKLAKKIGVCEDSVIDLLMENRKLQEDDIDRSLFYGNDVVNSDIVAPFDGLNNRNALISHFLTTTLLRVKKMVADDSYVHRGIMQTFEDLGDLHYINEEEKEEMMQIKKQYLAFVEDCKTLIDQCKDTKEMRKRKTLPYEARFLSCEKKAIDDPDYKVTDHVDVKRRLSLGQAVSYSTDDASSSPDSSSSSSDSSSSSSDSSDSETENDK